jgi:hypothetical protein
VLVGANKKTENEKKKKKRRKREEKEKKRTRQLKEGGHSNVTAINICKSN